MELAAVKRLLRAALEITKELDIKYAATTAVLQHGAKPTNPDDGSLEQQVQSLIDDPANKRFEKLKPSYVSSPVLNQTVKSGLASLV
jgi:hypothetical protein